MLKILHYGDRYPLPCALLLGGFDGIHTGHRTLLEAAAETGLPVGLTSMSGGKNGGDVFTFSERETIYLREGIAFAVEIRMTASVMETPAEVFLERLFGCLNVKHIFCGEDFRFGKGALGTPAFIREMSPCPVSVLPLKKENGEKVATSVVKEFIREGDMLSANRLLSGGYFLQGEVEHGRQIGRTYGFPTVNLSFPAEKYPLKEGVYGGRTETPLGTFLSVVNIGSRPTFGVEEKKAEAYLDGFSGDLYGKTVRIYPAQFYRPVTKFGDTYALKAQLDADVRRLRGTLRLTDDRKG